MCEMYLKKKKPKRFVSDVFTAITAKSKERFMKKIKDQPQSDTSLPLDANIWGTFCSLETEL